ncbi:MAG: diguanylate cyclase [Betaproteobacteria bacterium]|nr:diguanylate cyclase [Betaproteobacteria bacterium]
MFSAIAHAAARTVVGDYIRALLQKLCGPNHDPQQNLAQTRRGPIFDEVTGVHDQRHLVALLEQEKARSDAGQGVFCVGIVDVDSLGMVDDFHGRATRDNVLRHVAAAIAVELRGVDAVGRYGDEKFVFVLLQTRLDRASIPAKRVRRRIASLEIGGLSRPCKVTASIGLAEFRRGEDIGALMQRAESALSHAEASASNCIDAG